jgi:hypothetical protein
MVATEQSFLVRKGLRSHVSTAIQTATYHPTVSSIMPSAIDSLAAGSRTGPLPEDTARERRANNVLAVLLEVVAKSINQAPTHPQASKQERKHTALCKATRRTPTHPFSLIANTPSHLACIAPSS